MIQNLTWSTLLAKEKEEYYFKNTLAFIAKQRASGIEVYPSDKEIFNAFRFTDLSNTKVLILGQDPYHGPNQAHGLSFSVKPGVPIPPSLSNIYKELYSDIPNFIIPRHGYLANWANQGVMLLNSILTVESGKAHSHANLGWEIFTDKVIKILNFYCKGIVFLLWGNFACKKGRLINKKRHHVLEASHPSPLSVHRGFFGCRHFSKTNDILIKQGKRPIDWILTLLLWFSM